MSLCLAFSKCMAAASMRVLSVIYDVELLIRLCAMYLVALCANVGKYQQTCVVACITTVLLRDAGTGNLLAAVAEAAWMTGMSCK